MPTFSYTNVGYDIPDSHSIRGSDHYFLISLKCFEHNCMCCVANYYLYYMALKLLYHIFALFYEI